MVDLKGQYLKIKKEIDAAIAQTLTSTRFIGGEQVDNFAKELALYLGVKHVVPCANGTDALQIAMMALGLKPGDEVIVPAFTYVATAEVIALLGLTPVMVDVDPQSFNIDITEVEKVISSKTKAIVPVHLFGQSADMESIMELAKDHGLFVIEDNAQAIGSDYTLPNGEESKAGTIGDIGTISFFPSKNLACYGDGGCLTTNNEALANRAKMITNHGQERKYYHSIVGLNSRLDALQAGILSVKLKYLDQYIKARQEVATRYDMAFENIKGLEIPMRTQQSTHVFHQYTLRIKNGRRDNLKAYLHKEGIPSMIYYPLPLYRQDAYAKYHDQTALRNTETLCKEVLSLPIHTEMTGEEVDFIIQKVGRFFV